MARARNIKPAFFTNDELVELPFETRLLFIGLWMLADREGRIVDRPKKIKMEIFPADDVDCEKSISLLESSGFIGRYEFGNHRVIEILKFIKHQSPHSTEKDSLLPDRDGYFTVNERTKNGGITGKFVKTREGSHQNNVKPPLGNENQQSHNALNPECGILNPEETHVDRRSAPTQADPDRVPDIFAYWQKTMKSPTSKLDKKRIDKIRNALKMGYTPRQLFEAIKGCSLIPHNMGTDPAGNGTKYNSIELIFRDADHIDRFIAAASAIIKRPGPETIAQQNARIMAEMFGNADQSEGGEIIEMEDVDG